LTSMTYKKIMRVAAVNGCEDDMYDCIKHVDIDIPLTSAGSTALHIACMYGHSHLVYVLIDNEADVFSRDVNRRTPLDVAINCCTGPDDAAHVECIMLMKRAMSGNWIWE
jgi:hypothetical protein